MCRNGRDLRLLLSLPHRTRHGFEGVDGDLGCAIETPLDVNRAGTGYDVADPVGEDGVSQDRRCARSVTNVLTRLLCGLAQHLGAEVFLRILEIELLGDRDAIIAHERRAPFPLDQDGFGFGTERDADGIGELSRAAHNFFPCCGPEQNLFVCHLADLI